HDLRVVRHISTQVAVMYLGKIVESGSKEEIFSNPQHPYTKALLSAVPASNPDAKRERVLLQGDIPSPINIPSGCSFSTRCPIAVEACHHGDIPLCEVAPEHFCRCRFAEMKGNVNK
ncbi:MAG: ABC transporter ATP-binding protein, partial [Oscillospiraceae bacterium]